MRQLRHVGLGDALATYPSRLSGGRRHRMAIARALAMSPSTMLFDEGMTMICVTLEMGLARDVSDRLAFLEKGRIAEIGPPEQMVGAPENPPTQTFLARVR